MQNHLKRVVTYMSLWKKQNDLEKNEISAFMSGFQKNHSFEVF